jgi:Fe-S cluster assembly iron-binding protein IscA
MLQFTPQAAQHLMRVRQERGFDEKNGARFVSNSGRVGLTFAPAPQPDDRVVDASGIPVYLAPEAVPALEQAVVDVRAEDGTNVLVIRRQRTEGKSKAKG